MVHIPNMKCPKCAAIVSVAPGQKPVCTQCGFGGSAPARAPAALPAPPAYGAAPSGYGAPPYGATAQAYPAAPANQKKGMGIAGMVLGILGLCVPYAGVLLAIIGLILSALQLKKIKQDPVQYGGKGMAIAGLVCSIVGLIGAVLILLFIGAILAAAGAAAAIGLPF